MSKLTSEEKAVLQAAYRKLDDVQRDIRRVIDSSQDIPTLDKLGSTYNQIQKQKVKLSKLIETN